MRYNFPTENQEDTEDYMEHEHFEDILLPEREAPEFKFDQEDNLIIHNIVDVETIEGY